jgi:hypothetical protein
LGVPLTGIKATVLASLTLARHLLLSSSPSVRQFNWHILLAGMNLSVLSLLNFLLLIARVYACGGHSHVRRGQGKGPGQHLSPPTRPLDWGDINIIHTTDSHGWLLGHTKGSFPEPNYRCVFNLMRKRTGTYTCLLVLTTENSHHL